MALLEWRCNLSILVPSFMCVLTISCASDPCPGIAKRALDRCGCHPETTNLLARASALSPILNKSLVQCLGALGEGEGIPVLPAGIKGKASIIGCINEEKNLDERSRDQLIKLVDTVSPTADIKAVATWNTCYEQTIVNKGGADTSEQQPAAVIYRAGWYGFLNSKNKDREKELRNQCSNTFERIYVPQEKGISFRSLCGNINLQCDSVCDWEGTTQSCDATNYSWGDGARIAKCK